MKAAPPDALTTLAGHLKDNLDEVYQTVLDMRKHLQTQAHALQSGDPTALEQATIDLLQLSAMLERKMQTPFRQTRLLAKMMRLPEQTTLADIIHHLMDHPLTHTIGSELEASHRELREVAQETRQFMEALQFAFRCMNEVGEELLQILRGSASGIETQTYAANGQSVSRPPVSVLDKTG